MLTTKYLMVGNPGIGKSTIQNGFSNRAHFRAGFNPGGGLTYNSNRRRLAMTFAWTLQVHCRQQAAQHIIQALRQDGSYKILFLSLDSGRAHGSEKATMECVLRAAPIGIRYGIILTKFTSRRLTSFAQTQTWRGKSWPRCFRGFSPRTTPITLHLTPPLSPRATW